MNLMKSRFFGIAALLTLCLGFSCEAQAYIYEYRVLLPDGKPAVGAKVHALFGIGWQLFESSEKQRRVVAQTDAQGKFKFRSQDDEGLQVVVVDAPGCNLGLWNHFAKNGQDLKLEPQQAATGKVVSNDDLPVSGATVVLTYVGQIYNMLPLQDPRRVVLPKLTAKTTANGNFRMRGASLNGRSIRSANFWATAKIAGRNWMGEIHQGYGKEPFPIKIKVFPNVSVRGQVVHYATGRPLQGARVEYSDYALSQKPILTDSKGQFQFNNLPGNFARHLKFTHPDFLGSVVRVSTDSQMIDDKQLQNEIIIDMRPMAKIAGRIVDAQTGKPLPFLVNISASQTRKVNHWNYSMRGQSSPDLETGDFAFMVPVGSLELKAAGNAYDALESADTPLELSVEGNQNVVLHARKRPGYLIRFEGKNTGEKRSVVIYERLSENRESLSISNEVQWFRKAERWAM